MSFPSDESLGYYHKPLRGKQIQLTTDKLQLTYHGQTHRFQRI